MRRAGRPLLSDYRTAALAALVATPLALIGAEIWLLRRFQPRPLLRTARTAIIAIAAAALAFTAASEGRFRWVRAQVLDAEPDRLARLGRHFIVGYRDQAAVDALVERRAIAGIFICARNAEAQTVAAIAREVAAWQDVRRQRLAAFGV